MDDAEYLFKQDAREKKQIARSARNKVGHTGCKLPSDYMTRKEKNALNGEVKTMNIHKPMPYLQFKMLEKDLQEEFLQFLKTEFDCTSADVAKAFKMFPSSLLRYFKTTGIHHPFPDHPKRNTLDKDRWEKFWAGEAWKKPENDRSETNDVSEGESAVSENAPESDEKALSEEYIAEATEKLWNDVAEEAKWQLVEQPKETLAELDKQIVADSPKLTTCGRYGGAQDMTLDEVALEQPFSTNSLVVTLCDIRNWESVVKALSAFPLPEHNTVTITIYDVDKK